MAQVVRTTIGSHARLPKRRTLEDRVFIRWPTAFARLAQVGQRLPPRSRLRRATLRRQALAAWGAWVRGDLDLVLVRFAPDFRYEPPREWLLPGMRTVYLGHKGLREWTADMREAWEWIDNTPLEVIDGGDVLLFLNQVRLRARGSAVEFDSRFAFVMWIEGGLIVRASDYSDLDEALRVAGMPTGALGSEEQPSFASRAKSQ